jgi:hypothetical protein
MRTGILGGECYLNSNLSLTKLSHLALPAINRGSLWVTLLEKGLVNIRNIIFNAFFMICFHSAFLLIQKEI